MKHFLYLLFFSFLLISCNKNLIHFNDNNDQHLNYYRYTNKGLLAILDGKFKKSSAFYKKAFKNDSGFSMDYYNALKVADTLKDIKLAYFCAIRLAKIGEPINLFDKFPVLKSDKDLWNEIIVVQNNSVKYRDDGLYQKIKDMSDLDQKVREYYHESLSQEDIILKEKVKNNIDSLNYIEFRKLVKEFGFPSEKKLAIGSSLNPPYKILLLHFALHKYDGIIDLLNTAYDNFEISNLEYSYFIDNIKGGLEYRTDAVVKINNKYYSHLFNKEQLRKVDKHRKKIGLLTYKDNVRLIIDKLKNRNKLHYRYNFEVHYLPSEIFTKEKIKKNFVLIKGL